MTPRTFLPAAFFVASVFLPKNLARADDMASISIAPATGVVSLTSHWNIGADLTGFHFMAQDLSLGGGPNQFYSLKGTPIPVGGDATAFTRYLPASGAATSHPDIGSKLTPNSYSSLTSADPDLGYGAIQFYFIHHKSDGDYFTHLVPGSGTASEVEDLKPMSQPGGPSTGGLGGYFGLTFAASDLGYGANLFYYLRADTETGFATFGSLVPALAGTSTDRASLGIGGYNALAYTPTDVGYGMDQIYYQRLDPITGFTIFGRLDASNGRNYDIANLGSVFSAMTFVVGDVGFGSNRFYTTGAMNAGWQSVSFAAIADRSMNDGAFTVAPSASSGLAITLSVVPGSTGTAIISGPIGGVFTVTPTSSGRIVLQATQAGQLSGPAYEYNMLRQGVSVGPGSTVGLPGPFIPPGVVAPPAVTEIPGTIDTPPARLRLLCDFNRDGQADILWQNRKTGDVLIWLMDGTKVRAKRTIRGQSTATNTVVAAGDFDGDGRTDILLRDTRTSKVSIWLMKGTKVRAERVIATRTPKSKQIFGAADFNRDGKTDLAWRTSRGAVGIWLLKGKKRLANRPVATSPRGFRGEGTGDFNGDGQVDILWRNASAGTTGVWLMNGTALQSSADITTPLPAGWSITGTGYFNPDGYIDILLRNAKTGAVGLWAMKGMAVVSSTSFAKKPRVWEIRN